MTKKVLSSFATAVFGDDLDKEGYTRVGNAWYKIVPDVILSVELRKLRFHAFDITFGILPFSCFEKLKLCISYLQGYTKYWCENSAYYVEKYNMPYIDSPYFSPSLDSIVPALNDQKTYPLMFEFWHSFYCDVIKPRISAVHDLQSAMDVVGTYVGGLANDGRPKLYWLDHVPAFMKLGCPDEILPQLKKAVESRIGSKELDVNSVELLAEQAWQAGKINDSVVWYWLIVNNDTERMQIVVESNEQAARQWIKNTLKQ